MGLGIVFIASVPAYLVGFAGLVMGMGWMASLGLVALTGTTLAIALAAFVAFRHSFVTEREELA